MCRLPLCSSRVGASAGPRALQPSAYPASRALGVQQPRALCGNEPGAVGGPAAVGVHDEPARHVGRRADHVAFADDERAQPRRRERVPVGGHVTVGQTGDVLVVGRRGSTGDHAGRVENVAAQVGVERLTADYLDQVRCDLVIRVVVAERRAWSCGQVRGSKAGRRLMRRPRLGSAELRHHRVGQARCVVEQLTNGDLAGARVGEMERREVLLDRVVQVQPPGVDELHHREGGEGLAERGDPEERVAGHWSPGRVVPVAAHHQHLVAPDDRDRGTRDGRVLDLCGHEPVDARSHRVRTGRAGRAGPSGQRRRRSQEQAREQGDG